MKSKRRITIVVLLIVLLIASVSLAAAMIIPSAEDLLVQSLESLEGVNDGHAIVEVTAELPADLLGSFSDYPVPDTVSGTFEVWGKFGLGPEGQPGVRFEVLEASEEALVGFTAVSDGSNFWLYAPSRDLAISGSFEEMATLLEAKMAEYQNLLPEHEEFDPGTIDHPATPEEAVARLLEYVTADREGQETLPAGDAYLLRLLPIAEQMPEQFALVGGYVNLWLRTGDQIPLAAEFAESALGYGRVEATTAEVNSGLDDSIFSFEVPAGVPVMTIEEVVAMIEARVQGSQEINFEPLEATELPDGAVAAEPGQFGGALVQRYSLPGDKSFYIAQGVSMPLDPPSGASTPETVSVRGVEGLLFTNDETTRTILTWEEGQLFFAIGGDISPNQALIVAESLR